METRSLTLEDIIECANTIREGGSVELFVPAEGEETYKKVDFRDYVETMLRGAVPVIYERVSRGKVFCPGEYTSPLPELQEDIQEKTRKALEIRQGKPEKPGRRKKTPEAERQEAERRKEEKSQGEVDTGKILALSRAGWPAKEIADEMGITVGRVRMELEE
nr:MAG TPA: Protein of unknown function (DUF2802) [Caudoviricetes sp.]